MKHAVGFLWFIAVHTQCQSHHFLKVLSQVQAVSVNLKVTTALIYSGLLLSCTGRHRGFLPFAGCNNSVFIDVYLCVYIWEGCYPWHYIGVLFILIISWEYVRKCKIKFENNWCLWDRCLWIALICLSVPLGCSWGSSWKYIAKLCNVSVNLISVFIL